MGYNMNGFSGFGNSPAKQTKFPDSPGSKRLKRNRAIKKANKTGEYLKPGDPNYVAPPGINEDDKTVYVQHEKSYKRMKEDQKREKELEKEKIRLEKKYQ